MEGTVVDSKYQVLRLIGKGGMGAVYEARHKGTGRRVALKVIIPESLAGGDDLLPRFQREARASGAIDSKHVVQVLDTGIDASTGRPYLVMEYLEGEDTLQLVQRIGPLPVDIAMRVVAQGAAGLVRAHAEGIVHRDIKSANLFLAKREEGEIVVKILDFGVAKMRLDPLSASANQGITRSGSMLGSPLYMSPEQVLGGKDADGRSDVFSLGVTMYELLAGKTPNAEVDSLGKLVIAVTAGTGMPLRKRAPWIADEVVAIVERAMALEPKDRFQTATEMQNAIIALLPNGGALHESMLVPLSPAHREAPVRPSSLPDHTIRMVGSEPPPSQELGSNPALKAIAATSTTFAESRNEPTGRRSRAWLVVPLLLASGGGAAAFFLRKPAPIVSPAAESTSVPVPPAPSAATTASSPPIASAPPPVVAASVPVDAGTKKPPPVPVVSKPTPKPPNPCDPPYTLEHGLKHWKEECVK